MKGRQLSVVCRRKVDSIDEKIDRRIPFALEQSVEAILAPARDEGGNIIPETFDILLPERALRYSLRLALESSPLQTGSVYIVPANAQIRDILPGDIANGTPRYNTFSFNGLEYELDILNVSGIPIDLTFLPPSFIPKRVYVSFPPSVPTSYTLDGGSFLDLRIQSEGNRIEDVNNAALHNINFLSLAQILAFANTGSVTIVAP